MPETGAPSASKTDALRRLAVRWGGAAVVVAAIGFIAHRLAALRPDDLLAQASWPLFVALAGASLLFSAADILLARGWIVLADPRGVVAPRHAMAIYGRGVLAKYLPGTVFQYVSRQVGGRQAGLDHASLVKASLDEVLIHLAASLAAASLFLLAQSRPMLAGSVALALVAALFMTRSDRLKAAALQILAFGLFGVAAALLAALVLPAGGMLFTFAGMFLLAWLAGFLVPVAPGGLGVREAALLALAGSVAAPAAVVAVVLGLRIASILGDLVFGLVAVLRAR